jgi:hypothetical protein
LGKQAAGLTASNVDERIDFDKAGKWGQLLVQEQRLNIAESSESKVWHPPAVGRWFEQKAIKNRQVVMRLINSRCQTGA